MIRTLLKKILLSGLILCSFQLQAQQVSKENIGLDFRLDEKGSPVYSLQYKNQEVIRPSKMGFALDADSSFNQGFRILSTERKQKDETWKPVWGEESSIRNNYEELTVHLQHTSGRQLDIVFRVFADGLGFRYVFPQQSLLKYFVVKDEFTEFNLTGDHTAFWIPGDYDTNEYSYTKSKISAIDNRPVVAAATDIAVRIAPDQFAVQTPLMMKSASGLYINIHEAALLNYPAMQLHVDPKNFSLSASLVPDAINNKAYMHAPAHTPWRTVLVSDKAAGILASRTILNLNDPSVIENTSWIKPMKFAGVWWEYQTGISTWSYSDYADSFDIRKQLIPNGRHGANTANVKRYIDFAAANGLQGVLVEGWNTGWEDWFGNWKENVFDFVTPYPDFDVAAIASYAKEKGISMIMHNETSGSATNYERQLDTAFRFMNKYGYPSVKTGYVGRIIPRGEHHDGQWMVNHYERVLQKGAQYHVTVDAHEPSRPTGLHRTYPNFMASEAGRGNEYNAFSTGTSPDHETILPFTRLMGGPMDFTPGIFKLKNYAAGAPRRQMHSTLAKQLALYVTIYSPVQMVADLPQNYAAKPDAFRFIKDVPVDWDETKILEAEPGDYVTIARKQKNAANWFIGAVTDENSRTAIMPLSFLDKGVTYIATIYRDAADADWQSNPEAYAIESFKADAATTLKITLAKGGGAAVSIRPVKPTDDLKKIRKYK